jgi:hypothetical protein
MTELHWIVLALSVACLCLSIAAMAQKARLDMLERQVLRIAELLSEVLDKFPDKSQLRS